MKKALSLVLALIIRLGCFVFADCGTEIGNQKLRNINKYSNRLAKTIISQPVLILQSISKA